MSEFATSLEPIPFDDLPEGPFKDAVREDVALSAKVHCYRLKMFRGKMNVGVCPVYLAHAPLLGRFTVSERGRSPESYCVESAGIARSAHLWYVMPRLLLPCPR